MSVFKEQFGLDDGPITTGRAAVTVAQGCLEPGTVGERYVTWVPIRSVAALDMNTAAQPAVCVLPRPTSISPIEPCLLGPLLVPPHLTPLVAAHGPALGAR